MLTLAELLAEQWTGAAADDPAPAARPGRVTQETVVLVGRGADEHLAALSDELARRDVPVLQVAIDAPGGLPPVSLGSASEAMRCRAVVVRETAATRPLAHHNDRTTRSSRRHSPRVRGFAERENEAAVLGWLDGLAAEIWVNDPWSAARAEIKLRQLRIASACGLRIPETVVSADPAAPRQLNARQPDGIVYKSLSDPVVWDGPSAGFLYTTALRPEHLDGLDGLLQHAGLFQQRVVGQAELRVTVVGDVTFAVRLRPRDAAPVDWRRGLQARSVRYDLVRLDDQTHDAILATVRGLGLSFAAVDLIEDRDGYVFLEVNAAGAYRWLEDGLGLPISGTICDLLLSA